MTQKLPRTVVVLGLVSFFNDLASDIVIPLIPILLTVVLGAGPVALGAVEGAADALAALLKLWAGRHSDWLGGRRKGLTVAGYTLSNIARPLLGLAGGWLGVLALRCVDRVGKGIRSAPRDAMVLDATPPQMRGYAFGFHRAMDNGGAVAGSLLAAAAIAWAGMDVRAVILWSVVPGVVVVLLLLVGLKEPRSVAPPTPVQLPPLRWSVLGQPMRRYLLVLGLFTMARASETFILLRGKELGLPIVELLLLWAALNLAKAGTSTWGGRLADRLGRLAVLLWGWSAFAVNFLLMGAVERDVTLWLVTVAYGLAMGASEGAERAIIGDFARAGERGTAFGWYHLAVGIAAIPAGVLFGAVWAGYGGRAAFTMAGLVAAAATVMMRWWVWPHLHGKEMSP